jgi:hypothetical protein
VRFHEGGEFDHVYCENERVQLEAHEGIDRAQVAHGRATELINQVTRRRAKLPAGTEREGRARLIFARHHDGVG